MDSNFIQHHGIKGQRWGVRRYQNEDGTLTKAGKARQGDDSDEKSVKTTLGIAGGVGIAALAAPALIGGKVVWDLISAIANI